MVDNFEKKNAYYWKNIEVDLALFLEQKGSNRTKLHFLHSYPDMRCLSINGVQFTALVMLYKRA